MANSRDNDRKMKAVDKSPVHGTSPTIEMTKKSEAHIDVNSSQKSKDADHLVKSAKESQTIQKEDPTIKELRGALLTMKQSPTYQKVRVKKSESQNEADRAHERKEITSVTNSLEGKTILEELDETTAQVKPKSQDKEGETVEVRSTVPVENEVQQARQELAVQDVDLSREGPSPDIERVEPASNIHYVYPFTLAMAIWQDFAQSAVNIYNEFARELSRANSNWMNIFLNIWQSSNHYKKNEYK